MDADKSGTITVEELREGLKKQGTTTAQSEVESLLSKIDVDANGTLDYEEFIAATVNLSQVRRAFIPILYKIIIVSQRFSDQSLYESAVAGFALTLNDFKAWLMATIVRAVTPQEGTFIIFE